jgi:hypothetical protein
LIDGEDLIPINMTPDPIFDEPEMVIHCQDKDAPVRFMSPIYNESRSFATEQKISKALQINWNRYSFCCIACIEYSDPLGVRPQCRVKRRYVTNHCSGSVH